MTCYVDVVMWMKQYEKSVEMKQSVKKPQLVSTICVLTFSGDSDMSFFISRSDWKKRKKTSSQF